MQTCVRACVCVLVYAFVITFKKTLHRVRCATEGQSHPVSWYRTSTCATTTRLRSHPELLLHRVRCAPEGQSHPVSWHMTPDHSGTHGRKWASHPLLHKSGRAGVCCRLRMCGRACECVHYSTKVGRLAYAAACACAYGHVVGGCVSNGDCRLQVGRAATMQVADGASGYAH
eukprot:1157395-Pelagomonas_calceolata.AAC.1